MHSQNNEEEIIKRFFQSPGGNLKIGSLLSIGENDGEHLSNARMLIDAGWWATLIEPDERAFKKLHDLHGDNDRVKLFKFGIGTQTGKQPFWSSGTHLGKGDTGLLSTFDPAELERWKNSGNEFTETEAYSMTWDDFYKDQQAFELVCLDAEGFDLKILKQIDFNQTKTKMVVVEWNGKDRHLYDQIMYKFNFNLIDFNGENLIYAR